MNTDEWEKEMDEWEIRIQQLIALGYEREALCIMRFADGRQLGIWADLVIAG